MAFREWHSWNGIPETPFQSSALKVLLKVLAVVLWFSKAQDILKDYFKGFEVVLWSMPKDLHYATR